LHGFTIKLYYVINVHFIIVYKYFKKVNLKERKDGEKNLSKGVRFVGNKGIRIFLSLGLACMIVFLTEMLSIAEAAFPGAEKSSMAISSGFATSLLYSIDKNEEINTEGNESYRAILAAKQIKVIPGGQPIGVKLHTDGPLVVGFADIDTSHGRQQSPAAIAGIEVGDSIMEIEGIRIEDNASITKAVNHCGEKTINIKVKRNNMEKMIQVKASATTIDGEYKLGIWVRDSTAGIGTLTFYDPDIKKFGALGHPINDVDTGSLLSIKRGAIYNAKIVSVKIGEKGKPGELRGIFSESEEIGQLKKNTLTGIYGDVNGVCTKGIYKEPIPVAMQNEIKEGPAKILSSINGNDVKEYDIVIEKLTHQTKANSKSMVIRITDPELLEKTGGIVQGMSGSPIIQNGKLVGAITHVFVNKPDTGYGIYIEWMLEELGYAK
jgi:stage IV sporulation protein B